MIKRIELIFITFIFFIQGCGVINLPLKGQNQLKQMEKFRLAELSDRWAVVIGISEYKDINIRDLSYAHKDAKSFYDSLIKKCRFKKEQIKLLLNKNATYENIRRKISGWLFKNTNKNDKIIIFFSGHGYRDIDNNDDEDDGFDEFLVPFDYQSDDISSAIRDDEFAYWINSLKAENILLIFDSCFSGGAAKAKGVNNKNIKIKGEVKVDNFVKDIFGEVPKVGVSLLGASKADQISFEEARLKMGIFTYYLVNSMDKKSDMNLDNKITIEEMFYNLAPKVMNFVKSNFKQKQEPILINTMKNPFELVYIPIEIRSANAKNREKVENLIRRADLAKDRGRKIKLLEEACELDPKNTDLRSELALTYFFNKMYDEAIDQYEIAISISSKKSFPKQISDLFISGYYESISEVYEKKEMFEDAKRNIKKAIELWKKEWPNLPENLRYYNQLGNLYYKNNELSEAIEAYLLSLKLNEIQDDVYYRLSKIYIKLKKYDETLSLLKKAIDINPDYSEFYYLQALIYKYVNRDIDKSNKSLSKFYDLNKSLKRGLRMVSLRKEMLELSQTNENFEMVISEIERVIKEKEFYADAYIDLIQTCNKYKKNIEKAKDYYKILIEIYPFFEREKDLLFRK